MSPRGFDVCRQCRAATIHLWSVCVFLVCVVFVWCLCGDCVVSVTESVIRSQRKRAAAVGEDVGPSIVLSAASVLSLSVKICELCIAQSSIRSSVYNILYHSAKSLIEYESQICRRSVLFRKQIVRADCRFFFIISKKDEQPWIISEYVMYFRTWISMKCGQMFISWLIT